MARITDRDIEVRMRPVLEELSRYFKQRVRIERKVEKPNAGKQINITPKPNREQTEYLRSIIDYPNLSVTARGTNLFGFSSNKMTKLKKILLEMEFMVEFTVDLGKEYGGRGKLLRLTRLGYQTLKMKPPTEQRGIHARESLEHLWWKEQIHKDYQARGYEAEIEYRLNGKSADIGVRKGDETVAVEVELTPKNAVPNLRKNLEAGFTRTIIACKNSKVKKEVERKVRAYAEENGVPDSKYKIILLNEFPFVKKLHQEIRG